MALGLGRNSHLFKTIAMLAIVLVIAILVLTFFSNRFQKNVVLDNEANFISAFSSDSVVNEFGIIQKWKFNPRKSTTTKFNSGKSEGTSFFKVIGSKNRGHVIIIWKRVGSEFHVDSIRTEP